MTLEACCQNVKALILDVDGVLTDGGIIWTSDEREVKEFHVRDGSAIKLWMQSGRPLAILSGRTSQATLRRARELGVSLVEQGHGDKRIGFERLLQEMGIAENQVAYLGDDLPDVPVLERCGLGIAVADACPEVLAAARHVTRCSGGRGAVREAIQLILRCQGAWPPAAG